MKVLLTGPCGRIGFKTLQRLLEAGHQVRCFETRNEFLSHPNGFNEACEAYLRSKGLEYEWVWGDIRNASEVRDAMGDDIEAVIHHAAMTLPSQCEEEWEYCWDVNYYGTLNVISAIKAMTHKPKLIYASSIAVYGFPEPEGSIFRESDRLPSVCTYSATKIASEIAVRRADINYTILRIASSPDSAGPQFLASALPEFAERVKKELKLKMYHSPAHFVSVDDVNTACLNALDNPASDRGIFNIAGPVDCRTEFGSMIDKINTASGGEPPQPSDWGDNPYPQGYYDITRADAVLRFANTSLDGVINNVVAGVQEIGDFMAFYPPK